MVINDYTEAKIFFQGLFCYESSIDDYGNLALDMGAASAGRCAFRITDVSIRMEEREEEPGCADICPPRVLIYFDCLKSECIFDPVAPEIGKHQSGVITIFDIEKGRKAYEYLIALKTFFLES